MMRITPVVKNLIIINVLIWASINLMDAKMAQIYLAAYYPASPLFYPWQIITHMFMHQWGDFSHVLFNMFGVYIFGSYLERFWGGKRFLIFYMLCGLGAFFLHELVNGIQIYMACGTFWPEQNLFQSLEEGLRKGVVGASGALFGLILGFAVLFPHVRLQLIFPPIPIKARTLAIFYGGFEVLQIVGHAQDNVAHFAHLGGMLFGWLIIRHWQKKGT